MSPFPLLRSRRFLPLFLTQFLGALNDNFFKNAVVILVTYRTSVEWNMRPQTLVSLTGALFIFPYIVFCATAGKLADKFDKAWVARVIKGAELVFMLLAVVGFSYHLVGFLFVVLFCMGTHSAFFSPVKYALLPDQLREDELMIGNALMESVTFVATLLGTIAGGVLVLQPHGEFIVSVSVTCIAILGLFTSRFIPPANQCNPAVQLRWNLWRETADILAYVFYRPMLWRAILANSWFWFVCMIFLLLCPAFIKQVIGADEHVVTLFLTVYSIGIGFGAVLCGVMLGGKVSTRFVPVSALGISLFTFDLFLASPHGTLERQGALQAIGPFLQSPSHWRMVADLFGLSLLGGFYVVPLYSLIQQLSEPRHRARVMAANNVMNGMFMVGSSLLALSLFALELSVADVFLTAALLNGLVALALFSPRYRLTPAPVN